MIAVSSDVGMMGGTGAHEFMVLDPAGETCSSCTSVRLRGESQVAIVAKSRTPRRGPAARDSQDAGATTVAGASPRTSASTPRARPRRPSRHRNGRLIAAHRPQRPRSRQTKLVDASRGHKAGSSHAQVREIKAASMERAIGSPIRRFTTPPSSIDNLLAAPSADLVRRGQPPKESTSHDVGVDSGLHARRRRRHHQRPRRQCMPDMSPTRSFCGYGSRSAIASSSDKVHTHLLLHLSGSRIVDPHPIVIGSVQIASDGMSPAS